MFYFSFGSHFNRFSIKLSLSRHVNKLPMFWLNPGKFCSFLFKHLCDTGKFFAVFELLLIFHIVNYYFL